MSFGDYITNGLGRLQDSLFQVDPNVAGAMSADQLKGARQNALLHLGLGIIAGNNSGYRGGLGRGALLGLSDAENSFNQQTGQAYALNRQKQQDAETQQMHALQMASLTAPGLGKLAGGLDAAAPDQRAAQWQSIIGNPTNVQLLKAAGIDPTTVTPDKLPALIQQMHQQAQLYAQPDPAVSVAPGAALVDPRTGQAIYNQPGADASDTTDTKNYALAKQQGYKGSFNQWLTDIKKAGATTVSVDTKGAGAFSQALGAKVADQVSAQYSAAQTAPQLIDRARRVRQLVGPNGSAITGFGAEGMGKLAQIAYAVGIKSTGNAASDTEVLGHELAQSALESIRALGGGQSGTSGGRSLLNPANRAFIERAASGNLNYDAHTIARLADLNEQAAVESIKQWNASAARIRKSQPGLLDSIGASEVQMPGDIGQGSGGAPKLTRGPDGSLHYTP